MSSSEAVTRLADEIGALATDLCANPPKQEWNGSDALLGGLLGSAVRLYAKLATSPYEAEALTRLDVSLTDACIVAAALLRASNLTPFEFSVWMSATASRSD